MRASTELTCNITVERTIGHLGRVLDHKVRRRRLLEIGGRWVARVHGAEEPTRRVVRVPAVQDSLAALWTVYWSVQDCLLVSPVQSSSSCGAEGEGDVGDVQQRAVQPINRRCFARAARFCARGGGRWPAVPRAAPGPATAEKIRNFRWAEAGSLLVLETSLAGYLLGSRH